MVKDDAEAQELAEAALREKSFKLMRAECNVEGDCRLASGATVMMKYVGQPFDGEYITHAVIHRFSLEEGYITNFFLKRNMVDEEYMKGPTHVAMHSGKSPTTAERKAEEYEDNYGEEEEYEPLLKEILSVACCDKDGNKTTKCSEGQPITLEAAVNASVEEDAEVTFRVYRKGDEPERDRLIETLTGVVRRGKARVELDPETVGRIIGGAIGGLAGGEVGARIGREIGRFFVRASSEGCEEVQSEPVEIEEGLLVEARFSTYRSLDFIFNVVHENGNVYIEVPRFMTTNDQGGRLDRVLLEDYVRIGQFDFIGVTSDANGLTHHYSRTRFILREEMATLNPLHVAGTLMGNENDGNPRGIIVHSTAVSNTRLNRYVGPSRDAIENLPPNEQERRTAILGVNTGSNCWNRATNAGDWTRDDGHIPLAVHAWVGTTRAGTVATYQTLPWSIRGRHASEPANTTHIGFEICEFNRADIAINRDYLNAAYKEAVQLCAYLCGRFGFDPMNERHLIDHWGGSFLEPALTNRSADVDAPITSSRPRAEAGYFYIFDKNMNQFRADVQSVMNTYVPANIA